jgi:hypothetical protein
MMPHKFVRPPGLARERTDEDPTGSDRQSAGTVWRRILDRGALFFVEKEQLQLPSAQSSPDLLEQEKRD